MEEAQGLQEFLNRAKVEPSVFELRSDYRALLIAVDGISPGASDAQSETMLKDAEDSARAELAKQAVTTIPHVAAWQEAYKAFGSKPKKFRNSLEALTRRAEAGLPRVNRLTDIYNAISVRHQVPIGGEDLKKYEGAARLLRATGKESFETKAEGKIVVEHPDVGEVVWCDDAGVTCRRWNWRQGPRTALTDDTTSALFILDVLEPITDDALKIAADELIAAIKKSSSELKFAQRLISKDS